MTRRPSYAILAMHDYLSDWWSRQCLAFAVFNGIRKLPNDIVFRGVVETIDGWCAEGMDRTTGNLTFECHTSPYVAIQRMRFALSAEQVSGMDTHL